MSNKKVLITGAGGLIGSACAEYLADNGWKVVGIDNNQRQEFFGPSGSTSEVVKDLLRRFEGTYRHKPLDIRDRQGVRDLFKEERPDLIVHAAAQPSHDKAAAIPYDDFDVNAWGTLNVLV